MSENQNQIINLKLILTTFSNYYYNKKNQVF